MSLHFPNARLLIHDLTTRQKLSGVRALAKAAHEYGLIPFEAVEEINRTDSQSGCRCMAAARKILDKHFELKGTRNDFPQVKVDQVCSYFEREVKAYQEKSGQAEIDCQAEGIEGDCARRAPAVFDLLLQQVRRYP